MKLMKDGGTHWRTWPAKEKREFLTWLLLPSPIYPNKSAKVEDGDKATFSHSTIFSDSLDSYEQAYREWWNIMFSETELPPTYNGLPALLLSRGVKRGSPLWYCAEILETISVIRTALRQNDIESTAMLAVCLGHYISLLDTMMRQYEVIKVGAKVAPGFEAGRKKANELKTQTAAPEHQRWITAAKAIWRDNPELKVTPCARRIIKRTQVEQQRKDCRRRDLLSQPP